MSRYSAQFRNAVLKKLLPPESRSAASLAKEYNLKLPEKLYLQGI